MRFFALLIMCLSGSVHAADFKSAQKMAAGAVSYTHLTLPTILLV